MTVEEAFGSVKPLKRRMSLMRMPEMAIEGSIRVWVPAPMQSYLKSGNTRALS